MISRLCIASRIIPDFLRYDNVSHVITPFLYLPLRIIQLFHRLTLLMLLVCISVKGLAFSYVLWGGVFPCKVAFKMVERYQIAWSNIAHRDFKGGRCACTHR